MNHLTTKEILQYVDGTILNGERTRVVDHLEVCARCRKELEFQRALGRIARQTPLETASTQLKERVMERVVPGKQHPWLQKVINNLGNVLAMAVVLGILGYALSTPTAWKSPEQPAVITDVLKTYSDLYGQAQQYLKTQSAKMQSTRVSTSSTGSERLILLTFLSLIILIAIDGLVVRTIMRARL
ncbi:MAG: zf-HC2 domain-containing protein [Bacteroidota bacterium]